MECYVIQQQCPRDIGDQSPVGDPKLTYDNYYQDLRSWQMHGCSYESHVMNVIDKIIDYDNQNETDNMAVDTMDIPLVATSNKNRGNTPYKSYNELRLVACARDGKGKEQHDFNYPDKEVGYLSRAHTDF